MITLAFEVLALILAVYFVYRVIGALQAYREFRGRRMLTCPETGEVVLVELAARAAAFETVVDEPELRVRNCSRWPIRCNCGQDCLRQVEKPSSELRFCAACKGS